VPEEIDVTNAEALRAALLKAAASGHGTVAVDMTRTRFCDSSGLHALLAAHKRAQAEGREVRLVIRSAPVLRVFAITGVDRMIPNFTSLAEALASAGQLSGTIERSAEEAPAGDQRPVLRAVVRGSAGWPSSAGSESSDSSGERIRTSTAAASTSALRPARTSNQPVRTRSP
jgi:anti-sigma B factor antagonist